MDILYYPFTNVEFNNKSSILLDASFLLSLIYDDDIHHNESIAFFRVLLNNKCILYITNIISAEVLNQIMYKIFTMDVCYRLEKRNPINSKENIKEIIHSFGKYDKKILKDKRYDKLREIPYKKYFDNLSKNSEKRHLLAIYYNTAVKLYTQLENTVKCNYADISKQCLIKTRELMVKNMLSINDATHLAACLLNNIQYLLTLDGDFVYSECPGVKVLKI